MWVSTILNVINMKIETENTYCIHSNLLFFTEFLAKQLWVLAILHGKNDTIEILKSLRNYSKSELFSLKFELK
jgi:hypothetical protein